MYCVLEVADECPILSGFVSSYSTLQGGFVDLTTLIGMDSWTVRCRELAPGIRGFKVLPCF